MAIYLNGVGNEDSQTLAEKKVIKEQVATYSQKIRGHLKADDSAKLYFFSTEEEAITHLFGYLVVDYIHQTGKNQILTTAIEDCATLMGIDRYTEIGVGMREIPVGSNGSIDFEVLKNEVGPRTACLSLSWTAGVTGAVQPINQIASFCREHNILLHVRGSEALCHLLFSLQEVPIDFFTFDSYRVSGKRGVGCLVVKEQTEFYPLIRHVYQKETLPPQMDPNSLREFCSFLDQQGEEKEQALFELTSIRREFETKIAQSPLNPTIHFAKNDRLPHISIVSFPHIHSELLQYHLFSEQIYVTRGGGDRQRLDEVLVQMGVDYSLALTALAFIFTPQTTSEQIDKLIQTIEEHATLCLV
ncbi:MAG: Cysteine desulfurase IscS [Chlamydiia bacterium]|nr:Cysteine desulfurase IscS [Chlamydiia bacterium]